MKKLMSIVISIFFALSMTGLAFAQAADRPASEPTKAEEKAPKAEKKKAKKAKKGKKAKEAQKAKKSKKAKNIDGMAPVAEKK
jgi:hypothetical protein